MMAHEIGEGSLDSKTAQSNSRDSIKRLAPDFHSLSLDIREVMQQAKDPAFMAALMFKLVQEREQTNKLLGQINEKYDKLMFELKTRNQTGTESQNPVNPVTNSNSFQVLPEQDQMILNLLDQKGSVDANGVKQILGYKGLNAACQRLNKLYRDGHLKKIQSGKHVLYLAARV
jgi:hypothetical protein